MLNVLIFTFVIKKPIIRLLLSETDIPFQISQQRNTVHPYAFTNMKSHVDVTICNKKERKKPLELRALFVFILNSAVSNIMTRIKAAKFKSEIYIYFYKTHIPQFKRFCQTSALSLCVTFCAATFLPIHFVSFILSILSSVNLSLISLKMNKNL